MEKFLIEMQYSFNGKEWGANGPLLVTKVMQKFCKTQNISEMFLENCQGIKVLHPNVLYPVPWREWKNLFYDKKSEYNFENSVSVHLWGKHSGHVPLEKVPIESILHNLAEQNCPLSMSLKYEFTT